MVERTIVTAALPYANGPIHIGHLLEYIQADIYTRFLKLKGEHALYICASDMHGTPIEVKASAAGIAPEQFVERFWLEHKKDFASFLINFDNYYKTHSPENKELAEHFFETLKSRGFIYRKFIKVIYCGHCQRSLPDRFVKGTCPHCQAEDQYGDICEKCSTILKGFDLVNPHCVICNSTPREKESEHYFFKLSGFSEKLHSWINNPASFLQPEIKNWLNEWIKNGLDDWCISRDAPYFGFTIPHSREETGEDKFFYVWLDAPIGYISSTKNWCDQQGTDWKKYWLEGNVYHFIGKDIVYFHYLFWPAMFMAMGYPLPKLTTHGFITVNGTKMSKSRGTFFTAKDFLQDYSAEALRFYYASHLDRKLVDIDLNLADFQAVTNNVLVGNLGNFCYRTLTFAEKNYGDSVKITVAENLELRDDILALVTNTLEYYQQMDFKMAVKSILKIADLGNAYFQQAEPWKNKESAKEDVGLCIGITKILGILVSPILPEFTSKIYDSLGLKNVTVADLNFEYVGRPKKPEMLVQKIEEIDNKTATKPTEPPARGKVVEDENTFPVQMKVGKIVKVADHPQADKLYVLQVDFGKETRQVVAGLKENFAPEQLKEKIAVFCTNLKPAKLRGELSEAMSLIADDGENLAFLNPGNKKLGEEVSFKGMKNSREIITYDQFAKIKMIVKEGLVFYNQQHLQGVSVQGVTDGAKIS